MARKNIFQLVEENYDIQDEIKKIDDLFCNKKYFRKALIAYSLKEVVSRFLFFEWNFRGTCISVDEFLERGGASISHSNRIDEDQIINYLEVLENFIKLYFDRRDDLYVNYDIELRGEFQTVFCDLVKTLEKHMGITKREYKDRVILYPKNAPLEKVVDLCEDEDVQWELIRYVREDLSLAEKRKSLAYLATNLYIEKDKNENDEHLKVLLNKADNVLNNLHIRHNNKTGKWENEVVDNLDEKDAIALCDMVYNEMLTIVLLREHKEYDEIYNKFNKKQKEIRTKNKEQK